MVARQMKDKVQLAIQFGSVAPQRGREAQKPPLAASFKAEDMGVAAANVLERS
jgi:hypothetical protein